MKRLLDGYKIIFFFLGIAFVGNGIFSNYNWLIGIGGALLIVAIAMGISDITINRAKKKSNQS